MDVVVWVEGDVVRLEGAEDEVGVLRSGDGEDVESRACAGLLDLGWVGVFGGLVRWLLWGLRVVVFCWHAGSLLSLVSAMEWSVRHRERNNALTVGMEISRGR